MFWLRLLAGLAAVYLLLLALMYLGQSRLVHLPHIPGRGLVATPERVGLGFEEQWLRTADGVRLHGWYVPAPDARLTVLFLHGNAGNISHRLHSLEIFHDLGVNTFIFDYRGYGRSDGRPSEAGLNADALAAWRHLVDDRGIPPQRIIVFGRSLGGALAACLAARQQVGGVILESSFISVPELGAELYPFLPVRWLARLRYDTRGCLEDVTAPVLVVHSRDDEIIPFRHGAALADAAGAEILVLHGDHNTGFLRSGALYRDGLAAFLGRFTR